MPRENVEVVRRAFEAWNAAAMDRFGAVYASDAISRPPPGWPEPGPFLGREAIMREFKHMRETWDAADTVETRSDFLCVGDRVAVRFAWIGEGRGPGMDMEMTQLTTVREGKIHYQEYFWNHNEALEAVGLSE